MRARFPAFVAALLVAATAAAGPREVVDACAHGGPDKLSGIKPLEVACPGLTAALDALGAGPLLATDTRKGLTRRSLERVVALAAPSPKGATAVPPRASLDRILPTLSRETVKDSWWDRFKAWLRGKFKGSDRADKPSRIGQWLDDWSPSERFRRGLFYALAAIVIAAALLIVTYEARANRGGGGDGEPGRGRTAAAARERRRRSLEELAAAPLHLRAALMFELVLQALADAGRMRTARERTHRELKAMPPYEEPEARNRFARLAAVAEEQLFAPAPVSEARVKDALADGEALLGAVAAPPGSGP